MKPYSIIQMHTYIPWIDMYIYYIYIYLVNVMRKVPRATKRTNIVLFIIMIQNSRLFPAYFKLKV